MPKFQVHYQIVHSGNIDVEADDEEDARTVFYEQVSDDQLRENTDFVEPKITAIDPVSE